MAYRKASAKRRPPCRKTDPSKSKNLPEGVGPLIFHCQLLTDSRNEDSSFGLEDTEAKCFQKAWAGYLLCKPAQFIMVASSRRDVNAPASVGSET